MVAAPVRPVALPFSSTAIRPDVVLQAKHVLDVLCSKKRNLRHHRFFTTSRFAAQISTFTAASSVGALCDVWVSFSTVYSTRNCGISSVSPRMGHRMSKFL